MARSGPARVKEPKFFQQLDIFLGDQPQAIGIDGAIDTLSPSISAKKENTSDLGNYKFPLQFCIYCTVMTNF